MKEIRVLQFITPSGFYGAERWVLALANNISEPGVTCDLAVSSEGGSQDLSVATLYPSDAGKVHYIDMKGRFDIRAISRLVNVIKERKIDIIHTHGYKSDIIGLLAAKIAGIKCVSTPHGFSSSVDFKLGMFIKLGCFSLKFFDAVVPLSEELMEDMKRLNVPEDRTHFVRNGVDLKDIDSEASSFEPSSSDKQEIIVGFIGQLISRKRVEDLIEVFDQLSQKREGLRLQLVGDGQQRDELEELAKSCSSAVNIDFLGFRSDRLSLLSNFDMFCMTSSLEGIPRCLMEAMALNVPVIAYDIPGVDQLVEHNKTGLLAKSGNKAELEKLCLELIDNPEKTEEIARNARKLVDEKFSAARMANEYCSLFKKLLNY